MPADQGVFLPVTRRMHTDLCRFVSDAVYMVAESSAKDRLGGLVNWAEKRFREDVEVQTWAALEHKNAGRADKAKAAFTRALALAPGDPFLLHHLESL